MERQKYKLAENVFVYMEVDEEPESGTTSTGSGRLPAQTGRPVARPGGGKGYTPKSGEFVERTVRKASELTEVIKGVASNIPTAFEHAAGAKVEKLTLSFGLKAGGSVGVPLLTNATAEGSIGVVIECRYPPEATRTPSARESAAISGSRDD